MSHLSVWLRSHHLSGVADAFKGVEGSVITAVKTSPEVKNLETTTVNEVGSAAQQAVVGAISKASPEAGKIANEVATPFIAALEAFTLHFFQNATVSAETKPPAA